MTTKEFRGRECTIGPDSNMQVMFVPDLASLRDTVIAVLKASPMRPQNYLPMGHQSLVVTGDKLDATPNAQGGRPWACHVGALECASDLQLYRVIEVRDVEVDGKIAKVVKIETHGKLFEAPGDLVSCAQCNGLFLRKEPRWHFPRGNYADDLFCMACHDRLITVAAALDGEWKFLPEGSLQ